MRLKIGKVLKRVSRALNYRAAKLTRGFFCASCQKRVSHWVDWSPSYKNVLCPKCGAHPRHRLMALYLDRVAPTLKNSSVLHFAAEKAVRLQIVDLAKKYVTADLRPEGRAYAMDRKGFLQNEIDVQADITELPFENESFDVIICSHVLEHVPDDAKALREIFRVLKYDTWALLQTPFDKCRTVTLERPDIDTPELRQQFYQQEDHVRLYGRDIFSRFLAAGLLPAIIPPESVCDDPKFFGLWPDEDLMLVRKPWTWPGTHLEEEARAIKAAHGDAAARGAGARAA